MKVIGNIFVFFALFLAVAGGNLVSSEKQPTRKLRGDRSNWRTGWSCGLKDGYYGAEQFPSLTKVRCDHGGYCANHDYCSIKVNYLNSGNVPNGNSWFAHRRCMNKVTGEFVVPEGCSVTCSERCFAQS